MIFPCSFLASTVVNLTIIQVEPKKRSGSLQQKKVFHLNSLGEHQNVLQVCSLYVSEYSTLTRISRQAWPLRSTPRRCRQNVRKCFAPSNALLMPSRFTCLHAAADPFWTAGSGSAHNLHQLLHIGGDSPPKHNPINTFSTFCRQIFEVTNCGTTIMTRPTTKKRYIQSKTRGFAS